MVSGGAEIGSGNRRIIETLGFHMIQGYGLTETALSYPLMFPEEERQDSVGEIIPKGRSKIF